MIKHFIILASSYSLRKRIAIDYYSEKSLNMDLIQKDIDYISSKCGNDVPISTHFIQTEKLGWDNVGKLDKFFENVELIKSLDEFAEILLKDRELIGFDVAKYILTKIPCTHLKLEKLVYMCYADYLCDTGCKLFEDKILAYKYGPIVKSVYDKYRKSGDSLLGSEDDSFVYDETDKLMPIRSRILSSSNGVKKIISIDKTLKKYGKYSASELVNITHKKLSPWSCVVIDNSFSKEIDDDFIIKYHKYEDIM